MYNTAAIVLRRFELGEADRVLTVLTPHDGKLRLIAKGVRRPTSRLGGTLEPFAELQLEVARARTFDVITPASVSEAWLNLRDRLESTATAWYLAEDGRARDRGAGLRLPRVRGAPPCLPVARRRHDAGAGGALVRVRPATPSACARRSSGVSNVTGCSSRTRGSAGCPRWGGLCERQPARRPRWSACRRTPSSCCGPTVG